MNILFVNLTKMVNDTGGVAKVACAFGNEMVKRGHKVTLIYSDERIGKFYFPIDSSISCFDLRHLNGKNITFPLHLKLVREVFRLFSKQKARAINSFFEQKYLVNNLHNLVNRIQPDIIVAFQNAASKLLLIDIGTRIPVITMSHGDTLDYFINCPAQELPALTKSAVCQVLVPSFGKIIHEHMPEVKTVVIGNAIPQYPQQANLSASKVTYKILFVGRLAKNHKRPHLLIEAFAKLAGTFPNWQAEIWGAKSGNAYYKELEFLIEHYKLKQKVFLKGNTTDVASVLQNGDIFVFPSAYEGFGLALGEAMSMGLPAIGYKNCSAVNELIQDGVNGFLCDDGVDALADKLKILMENQNLRVKLGINARQSMKRYAPKNIWNQWEKLLYNMVNQKIK